MTEVPYIVHEGVIAGMERTIKRQWIVALMLICLLACTIGYGGYVIRSHVCTVSVEDSSQ